MKSRISRWQKSPVLTGLALALSVTLTAPQVFAKGKKGGSAQGSEKKKILVGGFSGPKGDQARSATIAALKGDGEYDVAETDVKPGASDESFAKASGGASAVIVGTVTKGSGLVLSVHNGSDGALVQDVEIKGDSPAKLNKNIGDTLTVSVADAIAQAKAGSGAASAAAAPSPAPKPAAKKADEDDEEPTPKAGEKPTDKPDEEVAPLGPDGDVKRPSPLEVTIGVRAVHRKFSYHDTPQTLFPDAGYTGLSTYQLPLGPAAFIQLNVFPLAFKSSGAAANIGITAGYEGGFATKSVYAENTPQQQELKTQSNEFFVGLRGRIPVGVHEVGLVAAYGRQIFSLLGDNPQVFPDVAYKFVKLGVDTRFRFDELTVGFHLGTRLVTDTGDLKRLWFSNTKAASAEGGLLLGYQIAANFELNGGVDITRYAFNFNPIDDPPADTNSKIAYGNLVAGGAVDQYTSGWLGVRYSMP